LSNLRAIMKEYEEIRNKHKKELEQRKAAIYTKLPRLREIEDELVKLSIDITKAILNNSADKQELLDILHKKQMDLKMERVELLSENRYPRDYLDMQYQYRLHRQCKVLLPCSKGNRTAV
jgi:DNA replication protein DnaC